MRDLNLHQLSKTGCDNIPGALVYQQDPVHFEGLLEPDLSATHIVPTPLKLAWQVGM
jgi:hypothetical protein